MSTRRGLSGLPLRMRLVAGFVVAMTLVLTVAGSFVFWRVRIVLDARLDVELGEQAALVLAAVTPDGRVPSEPPTRAYQLLDTSGRVLVAGDALGTTAALTPEQAQRARNAVVHRELGDLLPASDQPWRVQAQPIDRGPAAVLVVAVRRDSRDEALRELAGQLAIAGFGALLVASVVGERLAEAALRPVERYRTRAEAITAGEAGLRLDVPAGRDDEVTRLGHTLNDMLAALEQSVTRERRFLTDASHELRTPLTLLSARLQLLRQRPRTPAEHEAALVELETDVRALTALAEQLLDVAGSVERHDTHGGGGGVSDVGPTVRSVTAGQTDVAVVGNDSPVRVAAPDGVLRQVLTNLLVNARQHGAPPLTVVVRDDVPGVVVLTVTDTGPPLEQELLETAAERFRRGPSTQAMPGAGLGLSLVDALAQQYGGELRLCSAGRHHRYGQRLSFACTHPEPGTTATVALPAAPRSA